MALGLNVEACTRWATPAQQAGRGGAQSGFSCKGLSFYQQGYFVLSSVFSLMTPWTAMRPSTLLGVPGVYQTKALGLPQWVETLILPLDLASPTEDISAS